MKKINALELIALSVGAIIGWGAFILPGELFIKKIGLLNSVIGLILGALFMIIIEKSYKYMINNFSIVGGEVGYTYIGFGKNIAFLIGWILILAYISIITLNVTTILLVIEKFFGNILKIGFSYSMGGSHIYFLEIIVMTIIILFFSYCNMRGLKYSAKIQNIMVIILVVVVFGMMLIAITNTNLDKSLMYNQLEINKKNLNIKGILKIIAISPWAYVGFDTVTQVITEMKIKKRKIAILTEIAIILGCFIYITLILLTGINYNREMLTVGNIIWATGSSVQKIFGEQGVIILGVSLLMAVTAGINGFFMVTIKLIKNMIEINLISKFFIKYKKGVVFLIAIVVLIISCMGKNLLLWMTEISSLGAALGYLLTCLTVIKVSYKTKERKVFVLSLIGAILSLFFCILLLLPGLDSSLTIYSSIILGIWIVLGFFLYFIKIFKEEIE